MQAPKPLKKAQFVDISDETGSGSTTLRSKVEHMKGKSMIQMKPECLNPGSFLNFYDKELTSHDLNETYRKKCS